jgi:RimJ/RimL family protein N-acetyltransferase
MATRNSVKMKILTQNHYAVSKPLLCLFNHHTTIHTLLASSTPGSIYVDSLIKPSIAFAQFRHRAYISGSIDAINQENLRNFIIDEVFENCRSSNVPMFRLAASHPSWISFTSDILADKAPILADYQCYLYNITSPLKNIDIPNNFIFHPVNDSLIKEDFQGKSSLLEEMCSERETIESFLENSFGVAAFHEDKLAGWCLSEYNYKNQCEVGIATLPEFQRQGLATAMAKTFLNQAHANGIDTILWHCSKSNTASKKTALSVGFTLQREEQVLIQYINQAIHFGVQGNIRFFQDEYANALSWYDRSIAEGKPPAWVAWNAACAAAEIDQKDRAFKVLDLAIDLGFADLNRLIQSTHMTSLKSDTRWEEIITKMTHDFPS